MLSSVRRAVSSQAGLLLLPTLSLTLVAHAVGAQTTGSIRGRVTVEGSSRPLGAATVQVVGTALGAQTNDAGEYRINEVPAGPRTVRVIRLGFSPMTTQVTVVAGQAASLDITVREAPVSLDQIVVTATGDVRKKEISTSMATISAEQIQNAPVTNTQQLLAAQTPGVTVLGNSGQPGAGGVIRLRGNNSISQSNNPIIYVDGIRIYNGDTPVVPNARQVQNPFNDIRAEDIERVEVVKGAAATTLYGTEASGGVIQIFTKRGKAGRPQWNVELVGGTNDLDYLDMPGDPTAVYLKDCRGPELFGLDVVPTSATFGQEIHFEDATCPSSGKWVKKGAVQRYSLSVGGGADLMQYFIAGNWADEGGAVDPGENRTGGLRGNFNFSPSPQLQVGLNSSYQRGLQAWVPDGNLANGFLLNVARGSAGNYRGAGCTQTGVICMNNADALTILTNSYTDHFITGLSLNYAPLQAWTNRLTVGYDYSDVENRSIIPFGHVRNPTGTLSQQDWSRRNLSIDLASSYRKEFGPTWVSTTSFGGQVFQDNLFQTNVTATEFSAPGKPVLTTGSIRTVGTDTRRRVVNAGLFAQQQVGWRDRAFLTLGLRIDGNSAFGEDFGLQPYPKVGLSYVLSEHDWWPSNTIETFKLRGALGESGKAPGAFDAVRTWDPIAGDEAKPGFSPNQIGNKDLGPERTRELELGFETSAYAGRYSLDFSWFNTRTLDALVQVRHPPSEGFLSTQLENVGEVKNTGIEVRAEAGFLRSAKVDWRGRVNYTHIKSEAVDIGQQTSIAVGGSFTEVRPGFPVTSLFARKVLNADKRGEVPQFSTENVFIGPTFPDNIIGLGTTLTLWDKLSLDMLGEFQRGGYNINFVGYQNALRGNWRPCYDIQRKLIAKQKGDAAAANDVTALQQARCSIDRLSQFSDVWIESTDFFRLRYATLSYKLPPRLIPRMQNASLVFSGRNLWYSSDYSGLDPESSDQADSQVGRREYYVLPQLRQFSLALRLGW
jgi:TonB-dependent starch-binding outer membrane protein SusC